MKLTIALFCFVFVHYGKASNLPIPVDSQDYSQYVGKLLTTEVRNQIQKEVAAVVKAFSKQLPSGVRSVLLDALDMSALNKESGNAEATESIHSLQQAVEVKLAQVEDQVHLGFASQKSFLGSSQGSRKRYGEFRSCIADVIKHEGTKSGEACLTLGGTATVSDVQKIFENIVNKQQFLLPIETINSMQSSVEKYLKTSSLIPAAQDLIVATEASMLSVVSAVSGDYVSAMYHAEACFFEALAQPVYTAAYEYNCNVQNANDSTLNSVENTFRDTVNQYSGILPVRVVDLVQDIGVRYLQKNITNPDRTTRYDINKAILSVVASYGGNTASLTYDLLDCLNLVLVPGAGTSSDYSKCLKSPTGPAALVLNRIKGYVEQFYGVLPPKLVLNLEEKLIPQIKHQKKDVQKKAKAWLENLFKTSGAGPEYVSCYEAYADCVLLALGDVEASSTCFKGDACKNVPFATATFDFVSPYKDAAVQLKKSKNTKDTSRVANAGDATVYAEAAKYAKLNAKIAKANQLTWNMLGGHIAQKRHLAIKALRQRHF